MLVRRLATAALFAGLITLQLGLVGSGAACSMDEHGMSEMEHEACDHPVSHDECRVMAPCGAAFAIVAPTTEPQPAPMGTTIMAALITMPPSVSFPPKRRPPRA
jgi:hypothetical protein